MRSHFFGAKIVVIEAQDQMQASDGIVDNKMKKYESLKQS